MSDETRAIQAATALRFGVQPFQLPPDLKVGIAENVRSNLMPLNAIHHQPEGDTTGWYIWAGEEMSEESDFFLPLHANHLAAWCPNIIPYLGLPPGWRVLLAPDYEDVWFDKGLL